jgi:hydroxyacid-oxoacid transhydrogenase
VFLLIVGYRLTNGAAAYQGSNPISDIFSKWAMEQTVKYLPRIARDPFGDEEARAQML